MANIKKIVELLALIKVTYPYYYKDKSEEEIKMLTNVWNLALSEYTDKEVNDASIICIRECKTPPTPADIIERIKSFNPTQTNEEMWGTMVKSFRKCEDLQYNFGYTFVESNGKTQGQIAKEKCRKMFEDLPEVAKLYIGSYGEFLRISRDCDDETLKFERIRFMKSADDNRKEIQKREMFNSQQIKCDNVKLLDLKE